MEYDRRVGTLLCNEEVHDGVMINIHSISSLHVQTCQGRDDHVVGEATIPVVLR